MMSRMLDLSAFLGDELVIAVTHDPTGSQVLALAEVTRPGMRDWVRTELASCLDERLPLTIVDVKDAALREIPENEADGAVLLVTPTLAALSTDPSAIVRLASRIVSGNTGASTSTTLGERVLRAYSGEVQVLVSADLASPGQALSAVQTALALPATLDCAQSRSATSGSSASTSAPEPPARDEPAQKPQQSAREHRPPE